MPAIGTKEVNLGPALGYDPGMQVPLAGEPGYHADSGSDFIDERFAPLDTTGSGHGSAALKKFLEEQIAEKTPATTVEVGSHRFRVYYKDGAWRAKGIVDGQLHRFSAPERDDVISKLMPFAEPNRSFRDLDEAEKLQVARYAQCGEWQTALGQYLWLATDKKEIESPFEITDDPKYRELTDAAVLFVWRNSRPGYSPTPEREQYLLEYAAGRPLSMTLLDSAWQACQAAERDYSRSALLSQMGQPPEPSSPLEIQQNLEDADDETIRRTYWATAKAIARGAS